MKRTLAVSAALAGLATALTVPGTADAAPRITPHTAPAGSDITYTLWSDSRRNVYHYYGFKGALITTNHHARFSDTGGGAYTLSVTFKAQRTQPAGIRIRSGSGKYAKCEVRIDGRRVDSARNVSGGFAVC
ncbi:hypothetical protein GII33_17295 [Gordonia pseudamarae]|uniref:Uncharacterized protein n=1 Tax=Gordonia pseudamarae TaxID=2831662 RepID=A0ABX6IKL0_9ACTN|nr:MULTISPECIES: hypothetical protein [Gordonia]MBD0020591.1 hypothetical protein [Gordonia sp. (in: high G+C Gram-positive bacteria)]QHN27446.1 hypothetical protein GII33_17295 [Gordonia pseudamarae]QHN36330.1 hypothetical protein GII31_17070 [Gordonia pseudamarae]